MSTVELTLAKNYVPTWGVVDAIRELFQNAIDQEAMNPENVASWHYDESTQKLRICNASSSLDWASLLLGSTTKQEAKNTIGQFGEGYKIAALVLLREGKGLTIYNYGAREVWTARFIKSRRFKTDILAFDIEKKAVWNKIPSADLIVEVSNISVAEYQEKLVPYNLHLQTYTPEIETSYGEVLSKERFGGQVFVGGLYVCTFKPYQHGYNFKPGQLRLDRDRKLVSDFDLQWLASRLWASSESLKVKVVELAAQGVADVMYVMSMYSTEGIADEAFQRFLEEFGAMAIPVTTQAELDKVPKGYKGIIVPNTYSEMIRRSSRYKEVPLDEPSPLEDLWLWFETIRSRLTPEEEESFRNIAAELETQF